MRFFPHTEKDIAHMLENIGIDSVDRLFDQIPPETKIKDELNSTKSIDEFSLIKHFKELAGKNTVSDNHSTSFLGAGSYNHFVPEIVPFLSSRSEFTTSYTPYQPEISQGTLQSIYEYQTLICRLFEMEVANASIYDGASSLAEAILMATRITKKNRIAISATVHPLYRLVINTYLTPLECEIIELPSLQDGTINISKIENDKDLAALIVQSPNFFGCIEDLAMVNQTAKEHESLSINVFTEPMAYGLINSPGSQGADITCGEGQSFGLPLSFGGPYLGIFATKQKYVRNMPGRLVGKTVDKAGKPGFVLTLATREQHIRREKATSNICTNNNLCALIASIYLASLGGNGLQTLAKLNYDKSEYLKSALKKAGLKIPFVTPTFNEFVVDMGKNSKEKYNELLSKNIVAGLPLEKYYPEMENCYLMNVTEVISKKEMDRFVDEVAL